MTYRMALIILLTACAFVLSACGARHTAFRYTPYDTKPVLEGEVAYCFDSTGHEKGSTPYILGGTCCCTPTYELMEKFHDDGLLTEYDAEDLLEMYNDKGIVTAYDHVNCNNMCDHGPHVVKGGKCMVPPTLGTNNYEEIASGVILR